jgi:CBS domain containing-hemolysin-like protein
MVIILRPLIGLTQAVTGFIQRGKKPGPLVSEAELLAAASLGAHGGEISQLEHSLIRNIILLEEMTAKEIMTPRTVIQTVDGSLKVGQVQEEARQWSHTRIPVFGGEPEEVVGYVLKETVCQAEGPELEKDLAQLVQPLRYIPDTLNLLTLLDHFLRRREHIYLVVDEYGTIRGLVSLEDVLETLVGREIVDEKDEAVDMQELARRRSRVMTEPEEEDS